MKVDNIEHYTINTLKALQKEYEDFLEKTDGMDPDFPLISFNSKGKKIDVNRLSVLDEKSKRLIDKLWQTHGMKD